MNALIITDVQNDFLPGGSLAVKDGDLIIPLINQLIPFFDCVIATKDFHPKGHVSFASTHGKNVYDIIPIKEGSQTLWPDHCVQHTKGSEFSPLLNQSKIEKIFYKGIDLTVDSYSVFFDNQKKRSTGLDSFLKEKNIHTLYFVGLTTDYCIKYSVLDALELKFSCFVIKDACKPVNISPLDEEKALESMKKKGAKIILSKNIFETFH